jgi:hypothetical protein
MLHIGQIPIPLQREHWRKPGETKARRSMAMKPVMVRTMPRVVATQIVSKVPLETPRRMKFLWEHDFRSKWQCSATGAKILASVEMVMASSTFRRMGEGMFSSFGEPGRRKSFLMVSISARRAISNLLAGLSGSASSASRAFSAKEKGRFQGEESPHPVFGLQKAAMRAKSSAMRS